MLGHGVHGGLGLAHLHAADGGSAAARGMMDSDRDAETIARDAMAIAADICVYTNGNQTIEEQESIVEDKITKGKS